MMVNETSSDERYRQMFERNRAVKVVIDPDSGQIVQANPAACDFYGYPREQLQQMKIWQLNQLPEARVRERMAEALSQLQSTFVFRHRLASGEVRDVEVNASPIELQGSTLIYSIIHDITERKQAERTLWQHTKRLQIIHTIDQAILALKTPQEIAQVALRHLRQVVPARHASVLIFETSSEQAEVLALETGGQSRLWAGQRLPPAGWGRGEQWQNNVYLLDDLAGAEAPAPFVQELEAEGIHGFLSVPLIEQGHAMGRLNLGSGKRGLFTLQHLDIARQVADSLAVAIQNGRLYASERQARETADTLRAANLALTRSLDVQAVLATLLEYLERLLGYDSACVMLPSSDDDVLRIAAMSGYERWTTPEQLEGLPAQVFDAETTPSVRQVLKNRRPLLVPDTTMFEGWQPGPGSEHVRSWLGVPLVVRDRFVGLCSIDKAEPGYFTQAHMELAETLAAQAAVALLNAQLFEEVRRGRGQLQTLSRRLVDVQERERLRVARELHDDTGQKLTSLMVNLGLVERAARQAQPIDSQLAGLKQQVNDILESLHRLAVDLRPASLDHLGLVPALRQYVEMVGRQSGLPVQFATFGLNDDRLPPEMETSLYRIIQEALTNVIRHARATQAGILVERRDGRLVVIVEDNGTGFDAGAQLRQGRLGLLGMRERAEMLNGELVVESSPGHGTSLFVEIPWRGESRVDQSELRGG